MVSKLRPTTDSVLQRADEAFRDRRCLRVPARNSASSRCRRTRPPVESRRQIVRPVVVPEPEPAGHAERRSQAEAFAAALADRLQGLKSGPALGRMQADALGCAVIDGHEDEGRDLTHGHRGRHVRAPHHIGGLGGDGPVRAPSGRARGPRGAGPGGRAPASTGAPAPGTCGFPRPEAAPRLSGTLRHETATPRACGQYGRPGRRPGRRRPARAGKGTSSPAAAHTRWSGRGATRGRPAARRTPDAWRSRGRPSSPRPPPGQRAGRLQLVHLRVEQFVLHQ